MRLCPRSARRSKDLLSCSFCFRFVQSLKFQLRETEIQNSHMPLVGYKYILGLDVAMDDPFGMCRCQSLRNL